MEPWISSLAAQRIKEDEKAELMRRCEAVEAKIHAGEDHYEADVAFHHYIAQCTHNNVLSEFIPIITYSVNLFTRDKDPMLLQTTLTYHRAIAEAICSNDSEAAGKSMLEHILGNLVIINKLKKVHSDQQIEA